MKQVQIQIIVTFLAVQTTISVNRCLPSVIQVTHLVIVVSAAQIRSAQAYTEPGPNVLPMKELDIVDFVKVTQNAQVGWSVMRDFNVFHVQIPHNVLLLKHAIQSQANVKAAHQILIVVAHNQYVILAQVLAVHVLMILNVEVL